MYVEKRVIWQEEIISSFRKKYLKTNSLKLFIFIFIIVKLGHAKEIHFQHFLKDVQLNICLQDTCPSPISSVFQFWTVSDFSISLIIYIMLIVGYATIS